MESSENPSRPFSLNDAVSFWQRELHYYETRAGDQGRQAMGIVGIAAAAVATAAAALATFIRLGNQAPDAPWWVFLVLPVLVLFLWATGLRLIHEMGILRAYTLHCGWRLEMLSHDSPDLEPYKSWEFAGAKYDKPFLHTIIWAIAALAMTAPGILVPLGIVWSARIGGWGWMCAAIVVVVAIILVGIMFFSGERNSEIVQASLRSGESWEELGLLPVLTPHQTWYFTRSTIGSLASRPKMRRQLPR